MVVEKNNAYLRIPLPWVHEAMEEEVFNHMNSHVNDMLS